MAKYSWWMVEYPNGVKQVEWLSVGEAEVKARATGKEVKAVVVLTTEEFDMAYPDDFEDWSMDGQESKEVGDGR